ncbi:MAG: HAD-IA family hydrolase [Actinobacteria bacterium]|nr:HAD-IA family hydrolase [Actinomycetota bacterium]
MTVHTVIFDAGLTLLTIAPSWWEVFVRGCERAGIDVPDLDGDVSRVSHLFGEHHEEWRARGQTSPHIGDDASEQAFWRALYARFLQALQIEGDHEHATAEIFEAFREPGVFVPFPEVDDVLADLTRRGVRIAIVSNWGTWLREVLQHADLLHRFEAIVVSGEEGIEKPDPTIFVRALDRLGLDPTPQVAYVGDDLRADVEGSAAAGLLPVLVDRRGRHPDHTGHRVTDLRELVDVLPLPGPIRA